MRFTILLLLSFWLFSSACQDTETNSTLPADESPSQESNIEPPQTDEEVAQPKVQPLSPEDQAKAARAPEGMVFIKGGCFIMGNDYAQEDERSEHEVCLDDFYMDKTEVTQARWESVMGSNPSKFIGKDLPVEQVNYYDVQKFIQKSGGQCRLPTEAEWEYAAKGGTDTRYYWGNMMDGEYAWYLDNSKDKTQPVGQKGANAYGLHDMLGNVWEWTDDWYEPYYQPIRQENPKGPKQGEYKVIRGGAFDSSAGALRPTNRTWLHPKNRVFPKVTSYGQIINEIFNYIGFRCVQPVEPTAGAKPAQ